MGPQTYEALRGPPEAFKRKVILYNLGPVYM